MAFENHFLDSLVEVVSFHQFFQRDVHPPSPVVAGIGGDVDAFGFYIRVAQLFIDACPVLPSEYAQH